MIAGSWSRSFRSLRYPLTKSAPLASDRLKKNYPRLAASCNSARALLTIWSRGYRVASALDLTRKQIVRPPRPFSQLPDSQCGVSQPCGPEPALQEKGETPKNGTEHHSRRPRVDDARSTRHQPLGMPDLHTPNIWLLVFGQSRAAIHSHRQVHSRCAPSYGSSNGWERHVSERPWKDQRNRTIFFSIVESGLWDRQLLPKGPLDSRGRPTPRRSESVKLCYDHRATIPAPISPARKHG
jgi:hypothetical protein